MGYLLYSTMKQLINMPNNNRVVYIGKLTNGQLIQRIVEVIAIFSEAFLDSQKKASNNALIKNIFYSMDK